MLARRYPFPKALASYAGRRISTNMWKYRLAGRLAGAAVRRGPQAYKFIRRIARNRKAAYRRQRKRSYGSRSGPNAIRTSQCSAAFNPNTAGPTAVRWKTLNSIKPLQIDRGTSIRERLSGRVFVKGFKICGRIQNVNPWPVEMHWALIQQKSPCDVSALGVNFFRSTGNASERAVDFVDDTLVSTWNMQYLCNPINTQRYNIITHRKMLLDKKFTTTALTQTYSLGESVWAKNILKWIPIKRHVEYEDDMALDNNKPWQLVYWWLPVEAADKGVGVENINVQWKIAVYFSDGRN